MQHEINYLNSMIERCNHRLRDATGKGDKFGAEIERRELLDLHRQLRKIK